MDEVRSGAGRESGALIPRRYLADPGAAIGSLRRAWERFHNRGEVPSVREEITASWRRSLARGISPDRRAADVEGLPEGSSPLVEAARPVVERLSVELMGLDTAVVVTDPSGRLLLRVGDPGILRRTERQNFVPGSGWGEDQVGTNGIGLALALGRPAQVFSAEHFCIGFQDYACSAAPIRHPLTEAVVGALDVTTRARDVTAHTHALVVQAVRAVERELAAGLAERERRQLWELAGAGWLPLLAVDAEGRSVRRRGVPDLQSLLGLARRALEEDRDQEVDLELALGRYRVAVRVAHERGERVGALIATRPIPRLRPGPPGWAPLDGTSTAVREVCRRAALVADRRLRVVIEGEAGCGKLRLARALHRRASGGEPTVVGCAGAGWRAAWRRALGRGGTVVLLHPEWLDARAQVELAVQLAVLDGAGGATPWLITVTRSAAGLDPGLGGRLAAARIRIPPLRERPGDVDALVAAWCEEEARSGWRPVVAADAMAALRTRTWPGNVGQLRGVLADAWLAAGGAAIRREHLGPAAATSAPPTIRDLEREAIERALERNARNVTRAAGELGISRATLHRRLAAYRRLGRPVGGSGPRLP